MADKGTYTYEYPRPMVTVDAVVFAVHEGRLEVLLVQRGSEPYAGVWALPGGFVEMDEPLADAAARELREETGLHVPVDALTQVGAFGDPGRDPRGRSIGVAYMTRLDARAGEVAGADDAADAAWFPVDNAPPLAFDHAEILAYARMQLA
jgi:8-oxo-dGTP diphosphatase